MRKLGVFNNVTADGYFSGPGGDYSWAHGGARDPEFEAFVAGNAQGGGALLLGRITYELMASFWPTPAAQVMPDVAAGMNRMEKLVVSRSLDRADWNNSRILTGDLVSEVRRIKESDGPDIVILGSGSIVSPLASAGLIDEFQMVVVPVVIGHGRTMFEGMTSPLKLRLTESRRFTSGKVFNRYVPG